MQALADPATGWFEIHQYDDKRSITVANIAEQECGSLGTTTTTTTHMANIGFSHSANPILERHETISRQSGDDN
jgi:hypothetical protein